MIQVLGLRNYTHPQTGKLLPRETFFEKGWRFEKIQDVFNPVILQKILDQIPPEEHYNLYFTEADCFEESGRKLKEQWAIPFDIDGLELTEGKEIEQAGHAARIALQAIGLNLEDASVVFTGNGVQFHILLDSPITDENYFNTTKTSYAVLASKMQGALNEAGIVAKMDTSVWSKARIMRLPNTINRKPNKIPRRSHIISEGGKVHAFDVVDRSGVAMASNGAFIADEVIKNYPAPDTKGILAGCNFLKYCKENPNKIDEPAWYAMVSITARLEEGDKITHEYSQGHSDYNAYETDNKIEQALVAAGPRTCSDIATRWGGCQECPHYNKITSPIMIKGPDYIASSDFGFRERKVSKDGKVTVGRVQFADLKKQFALENIYKTVMTNQQVVIFNGKHWEYLHDMQLKAWCMKKVVPEPTVQDMNEFVGTLKAHHVTTLDEIEQSKDGMINFANCVLDMRTGATHKHSPDFGFFDVRPFNYDPSATSPTWDKFVRDVMSGEEDRVQLLQEYCGYCISNDPQWLQVVLTLYGEGANGKSVLLEVLGEVVGKQSHSAVPMKDLQNPTRRYQLINKLFNYSEETNINSFLDSDTFKALSCGGVIGVKQLYSQPYDIAVKTKLIMACNQLPILADSTHGFTRRLVILEFKERFTPGDGKHDFDIKSKLLKELPGICNTIIAAYKQTKERGRLPHVKSVVDELEKYKADHDTVVMFYNECLIPTEGVDIKVSEAYEDYKVMCEIKGFKPRNSVWFGRDLSRIVGKPSMIKTVGNVTSRYIEGFKITKEY